jgi:hypothetical protein
MLTLQARSGGGGGGGGGDICVTPLSLGSLSWTFQPCQKQTKVVVGEAALAFYKAKNLTDTAITGVST